MSKRSLILYYSMTGNTEKVVQRFKQVFEKRGWECDLLKVDKNTPLSPSPFDCDKYDFICVGSGVYKSLASWRLIDVMRQNPQSIHYGTGIGPAAEERDPTAAGQPVERPANQPASGPPRMGHKKIVFGPEAKKGIVFVTYAGHDFGPSEAVPALENLALELEHLKFKCAGKFCCPGKYGNRNNPEQWFKDLTQRPHPSQTGESTTVITRTVVLGLLLTGFRPTGDLRRRCTQSSSIARPARETKIPT